MTDLEAASQVRSEQALQHAGLLRLRFEPNAVGAFDRPGFAHRTNV